MRARRQSCTGPVRARAAALPHQLRNLHGQLLAAPAAEVHTVLKDMIERNDLLSDSLEELKSDTTVLALLEPSSAGASRAAQPKQEVSQ